MSDEKAIEAKKKSEPEVVDDGDLDGAQGGLTLLSSNSLKTSSSLKLSSNFSSFEEDKIVADNGAGIVADNGAG